jgi:shikimate kinase / 3-dehydroquinate synthase
MRDVFLTGFMGTGKTTVGRILAVRYGLQFLDLDEEVERRAGRSASDIFASEGEAAFRLLEAAVLRELIEGEGRVIATGGGTLLSDRNRSLLQSDQSVICLTCGPDEIERRLGAGIDRPLLQPDPAHRIEELLEQRWTEYEGFEQVDTTGRAPEVVADDVALRLELRAADTLHFGPQHISTILFETGMVRSIGDVLRSHELHGDVVLVTDVRVAGLGYADLISSSLGLAGYTVHPTVLGTGEPYKTLDSLQELYDRCVQAGIDRGAIVLGLGGGVVGDIGGMLAATYLRGLRLVLVPTTLLAQVDASIGGKVGVDFRGVKNIVGAFHPADLVVIDPATLQTLPGYRMADGLAEIIKVAMMRSAALMSWIETLESAVSVREHPGVIRAAAHEKARVVQLDPYEQDMRALLNFGHTIGHAVEAASGFRLSHGEAISVGMAAETWLAVSRGWCEPEALGRLLALLQRFELPREASGLDPDDVFRFTQQDKKRADGTARLAVPAAVGRGDVIPVSHNDVMAAIYCALGGIP